MSNLKKILYVDDEPSVSQVAVLVLQKIGGFDVLACTSGQEALNAVEGFQPDLLLLDVMMPEMDGPATLEKLRVLPVAANVPVIFMTGRSRPEDITSLKALGAIDVITKPFDPAGLPELIYSIWQQATRSNN
jgi:CheY-like chemotaxis protein